MIYVYIYIWNFQCLCFIRENCVGAAEQIKPVLIEKTNKKLEEKVLINWDKNLISFFYCKGLQFCLRERRKNRKKELCVQKYIVGSKTFVDKLLVFILISTQEEHAHHRLHVPYDSMTANKSFHYRQSFLLRRELCCAPERVLRDDERWVVHQPSWSLVAGAVPDCDVHSFGAQLGGENRA